MMNIIKKTELDREYRLAVKNIKQANKGLSSQVKVYTDYSLIDGDNGILTMQICYMDGDYKQQVYNIAL